MQALSAALSLSPQDPVYTSLMPRTRKKERAAQGVRLSRLRKAAGLTQVELAELLGVPQSNIAFWEQSEKPPRSDVLPAMAEAFGVSVAELLGGIGESALKKSRAPGRVRQVFDDVSKLPRRQQEHIAKWVSAFVRQYEQERR